MISLGQTPGLRRRQVGASSTLIPVRQAAALALRGAARPFTLYNATDGATLKVGIAPGLVNGISPTYTGASPSGELEDNPPPLLTITATTYFWLKVVGTFGAPDTYVVTVESNTTGTTPSGTAISATAFTSFLPIGSVTVASSAITAITPANAGSNWNAESIGSANVWWR